MNFKTTITLLIVLAAIGGFLLFTRSHEPAGTSTATNSAAASKVLDIKSEDVTKIAILPTSGKSLVLQKSGADWNIVEPTQAPADSTEVEALLRDMTGLESHSELDSSKKSSVGLDNPPYKIELTTKDKTVKLDVGDRPPLGDDLAVDVEGAKPQIVSAALLTRLQKQPSAYRKTKLLSVTNDAIKQIEITRPTQTIHLVRTATGWEMTAPQSMPADSAMVDSMLYAISGLNASGFDDSLSSADAGLSKPRLVVSYSTEAPTTSPSANPTTLASTHPVELTHATTISFGGYEDVTKKDVYVSIDKGNSIAKVATSTMDSFRKLPLDLRDKKVVDLDPDRVESFSIEVNHAGTTQPATGPAANHTYAIARRKESRILGPQLPGAGQGNSPAAPSTTAPATAPADVSQTTRPASPEARGAASTPSLAPTTEPSSTPTSAPAVEPVPATLPTAAATGPATLPTVAATGPTALPGPFAAPAPPPSKWMFTEGNTGDAEETQVDALLTALHPLKADKFLEPPSTTTHPTSAPASGPATKPVATYVVTLHAGPSAGSAPADYTITITDPGNDQKLIGEMPGLRFELDRALLKNLDGDFKTKIATPEPTPAPSFGGPGGGGFPGLPPGHPGIRSR